MPSSGGQKCARSEEHTSELQSHDNIVCRLLLEKKTHRTGKRRPPLTQPPGALRTARNVPLLPEACCAGRNRTAAAGAGLVFSPSFFLMIRRPPRRTTFAFTPLVTS